MAEVVDTEALAVTNRYSNAVGFLRITSLADLSFQFFWPVMCGVG